MKNQFRTASCIVILTLSACGKKDDTTAGNDEPLSQDVNVSKEVVQSNVQESVDALGEESSGTSLAMQDEDDGFGLRTGNTITRTCSTEGSKAKVEITSEISKEVSVSNRTRSFKKSLSGSGTQTRTWAKSGASISCNSGGKYAQIDWRSVDGLTLNVSFSRARSQTDSVTNLKKNTSSTRSMSYDASGVRTITWSSASASDDTSSSVTRRHSMVSSVSRSFSVTKTSGEKVGLKLTTEVLAAAPLKVTAVRAVSSLALQSKLVESGTMIATNKDGQRVESAFSNVKINYADGNCTPESGSITSKFFAKDATEASKTVKLTFEDGVGTLTDESGAEIGTVEQNGCDPEDLQ